MGRGQSLPQRHRRHEVRVLHLSISDLFAVAELHVGNPDGGQREVDLADDNIPEARLLRIHMESGGKGTVSFPDFQMGAPVDGLTRSVQFLEQDTHLALHLAMGWAGEGEGHEEDPLLSLVLHLLSRKSEVDLRPSQCRSHDQESNKRNRQPFQHFNLHRIAFILSLTDQMSMIFRDYAFVLKSFPNQPLARMSMTVDIMAMQAKMSHMVCVSLVPTAGQ